MSRGLLARGVLVVWTSSWAFAGGGQWPRFRGPNGTGISDATTVPATWTQEDYNWRVKLPGAGHSSPVIWGSRIFVTCGDRRTATRMILCLDAPSGRTLWRRDYPSKTHRQHRSNSYASATPAADAHGVVVTWTTPAEVVLLALGMDGREAWRRNLGPYVGIHGSGASPIIVGDLVVLTSDQTDPKALPSMYGRNSTLPAGKSFVIAVDRKSGRTRWQLARRTRMAAYPTPCVRRPAGGRPELIFASTAHGITALDPATGKINWEIDKLFRDRCVGSPVLAPGLVLAGYGYGTRGTLLVAVRPGSRETGLKPQVAYEVRRPVPLVPTPLVKDGWLFLWGDDGTVACLEASSGKLVWRQRIGGSFFGSPVWVDGRLYCIAMKGQVVVLAASDTFKVLARVPLGEMSYATPAVADGVMYLRTRSQLFSLGGKRR